MRDSKLLAHLLFLTYILQRYGEEGTFRKFLSNDLSGVKTALEKYSKSLKRNKLPDYKIVDRYFYLLSIASQKRWYSKLLECISEHVVRPYGVESLLLDTDLADLLERAKGSHAWEFVRVKNFLECVVRKVEKAGDGILKIKESKIFSFEYVERGETANMSVFLSSDVHTDLQLGVVGQLTLRRTDADKALRLQSSGRAFINLKHSWYHFPSNRIRRVPYERWQVKQAPRAEDLLLKLASQRHMTEKQLVEFSIGAFPFDLTLFAPLEGADGALALIAATELRLDKELVPGGILDTEICGRTFHVLVDPASAFHSGIVKPGNYYAIFGAPITAPNYLFIIYLFPECNKVFKPMSKRAWGKSLPQIADFFNIK